MMRRLIVIIAMIFLFFQSVSSAEIIHLKTGRTIRGQIVEHDDKQIKVDISGVKITYFLEEIELIEDVPDKTAEIEKNSSSPAPSATETVSETTNTYVPATPLIGETAPALPVASVSQGATSDRGTPPETNAQKKELILSLIKVSGTQDTMSQMFNEIITQAPADKVASLKNVLNVDEVFARLIPIYDKYFTDQELGELISFYDTPTGRKLIKVMPSIMDDSMNASLQYFQEKMPASEK